MGVGERMKGVREREKREQEAERGGGGEEKEGEGGEWGAGQEQRLDEETKITPVFAETLSVPGNSLIFSQDVYSALSLLFLYMLSLEIRQR